MKWRMVTLEEVANIVGGSTPSRDREEYWNGSIPWLTPTDLPMPGKGIADVHDTSSKITKEGLATVSTQLLPVNTVLFSSRATIGKLGISRVPLATNQGFANFIPKKIIESKYLAYCLLYFTSEVTALAGSTTFKEVTKAALKKFKIPLPTLSEQRRIVGILDQADALRRKRMEADAKAIRILPALFYKMFGDPLSIMHSGNAAPLSQMEIHLQNGFACGEKEVEGGIPHLRMNNIDDAGIINLDLVRTVPVDRDEEKYRLQVGDLLFMGTNSEDKIGKTCLFIAPDNRHYLFSNHLIRIRIHDKRITPEYLSSFLHLLWNKRFYPSIAKRWVNQASVPQNVLTNIRIPIPNPTKMRDFSVSFQKILVLRSQRIRSSNLIDNLFQSLLYKAFNGGLTAKWREDHMKKILVEMENQTKMLRKEDLV